MKLGLARRRQEETANTNVLMLYSGLWEGKRERTGINLPGNPGS
jgi:hypothetical protein